MSWLAHYQLLRIIILTALPRKWTLTGSVVIMVFFGALLGLGNPDRKGMMMAFAFLSQTGFGWAQMLSITFIQFGVPQVELGVSGGLAGVSRFGEFPSLFV